jgi:alkylation response protein AidB-like acyl-CoA dehydrogenase
MLLVRTGGTLATATEVAKRSIPGGSFLIGESQPEEIMTPEDFSEEQRQIARTASDFVRNEVLPQAEAIEAKKFDVTRALLKKAGDLGLMAVDIPEEFGGLAMDKVTSAIVADHLSQLGSFSVAFSAHVGIGTLPIVWYGTAAQKQKFLPRLATGDCIGAYALSEATSGSDAMNIRTRAELSPDGTHYILNGEKMWISNGGFADLFTVFAKVDGEKFSAFLIEKGTPGLSIGNEEHKLGIRGSSTTPLVLSDCKVPAENLLGEVGKGHHIAFNILNIGRFKLGAACVGAGRTVLGKAIGYAKQRQAFGKPISGFGLIQQKLADCAAQLFAVESMAYRTVGMIDDALSTVPAENSRDIQKRIEEYAVECSILKVWGSEMLDAVVDHAVQIYGGYGYVEEYPVERAYRDSRINRIFEGTNEINRLIITGWLMKRAMAGQLPLLASIKKLMDEVLEPPSFEEPEDHSSDPLYEDAQQLANAKKLALFTAGVASQKYMAALADQQEVMADLADIIIQVYALESALLRARKLIQSKHALAKPAEAMVHLYAAKAMDIVELAARRIVAAVAEGDTLRVQLAIARRLAKRQPQDVYAQARQVAQHLVEYGVWS